MQRHPKFGEVIFVEFQYEFKANKVSGLGFQFLSLNFYFLEISETALDDSQ